MKDMLTTFPISMMHYLIKKTFPKNFLNKKSLRILEFFLPNDIEAQRRKVEVQNSSDEVHSYVIK